MKFRWGMIVALSFCGLLYSNQVESLLTNCPQYNFEQYRVIPYIQAAMVLQEMGSREALDSLYKYSDDSKYLYQIMVLARMLFESEPGKDFRRPLIGGAVFIGNTDYDDWSLEPICLVDGVPFLIVRGYILGGLPESATSYLDYCRENARWKDEIYQIPSQQQLEDALNQLITSGNWDSPLNLQDVEFLTQQIN